MRCEPVPVRRAEDAVALAAAVNRLHAEGRAAERASLEKYRACGRALMRLKALVGHGGWAKFVAAHLRFGTREASRYIELAKSDVTSDLPAEWRRICGNGPAARHAHGGPWVRGRVRYLDAAGRRPQGPLQGQTVFYLGRRAGRFAAEFGRFGLCLQRT